MEWLLDQFGEGPVLAGAGALTGVIFGIAAQRSAFCLRAATVEVAEGHLGPRLAVWLVAFCAALAGVQGAVVAGWLSLADVRQIASPGSLSGAIIGGLMFGAGMILARGCASRLLVLSATGNLRALVSGLVVTLVAQAAMSGVLSPAREALAGLWTVSGGATRNLAVQLGLAPGAVFAVALVALAGALVFARRHAAVSVATIAAGIGVGFAVALGWLLTFQIAQFSFEVIPVGSVTFTGPSTDTLMTLVNAPAVVLNFGIGLVPGVAIGAGGAALAAGQWKLQRFGPDTPMERYLVGAVLMGFGAMLAGGCAVGAGLSGGAAMSLTAWLAVFCMWLGAMATHRLIGHRAAPALRA